MQWNCQGLSNKKNEILSYIEEYKVDVMAVQETKLYGGVSVKLPGYNVESQDGHFNRTAHGGVATYIHSELPYSRIQISSRIQAVAIRVQLKMLTTICNIYSSRSHQLTATDLNDLIAQLPRPLILLGDFNAYHQMWGSINCDARGEIVSSVCLQNNLNILNSGEPRSEKSKAETQAR